MRDPSPFHSSIFDWGCSPGFSSDGPAADTATSHHLTCPSNKRVAGSENRSSYEEAGRHKEARWHDWQEQTRTGNGNCKRSHLRRVAKLRDRRNHQDTPLRSVQARNSNSQQPAYLIGPLIHSTAFSQRSLRQRMIRVLGDKAGAPMGNATAPHLLTTPLAPI